MSFSVMENVRQKILDALGREGIEYELTEHDAAFTIEQIDEMNIDEKDEIAKNLFLRNDSGRQHYLVVLEKHKTADLKIVRAEIGSSRLSFASEERLFKHLGLKKGSVSPLGVLNDNENHVKVFLDKDLMNMERIGVHPGENTATVFMRPGDLVRVIENHGNTVDFIDI